MVGDSDITIETDYNVSRVLISYGISFLGAYLATSLCEQLRASYLVGRGKIFNDLKWFSLMGISLGGVGIWCMHFIGMSSVSLSADIIDDATGDTISKEIPIYFNVAISIVSLIVVIVMTTLGVMISANDPLFMKTKGEILEMFIQDTSKLSIGEVRKMKNSRLFFLITTKSLGYLIAGGIMAGSGVSVMHYIGMEAMSFPGRIIWDPVLVLVSVLIAIIAATVAFWILFRLLSLFPNREFLRIVSSVLMGIAVCGMHYTGMVAGIYIYEGDTYKADIKVKSAMMNKENAYIPVLVAAIMTVMVITIILLADLRGIVHRYNQQVRRNMLVLNSDSGQLSSDSNLVSANTRSNHSGNYNNNPSVASSGAGSMKEISGNGYDSPHVRPHTHKPKHQPNYVRPHPRSQQFLQYMRPQLSFTASIQGLKIFPSFSSVASETRSTSSIGFALHTTTTTAESIPSHHGPPSPTSSRHKVYSHRISSTRIPESNTPNLESMDVMTMGMATPEIAPNGWSERRVDETLYQDMNGHSDLNDECLDNDMEVQSSAD